MPHGHDNREDAYVREQFQRYSAKYASNSNANTGSTSKSTTHLNSLSSVASDDSVETLKGGVSNAASTIPPDACLDTKKMPALNTVPSSISVGQYPQGQLFPPSSAGSSALSSRKPSVSGSAGTQTPTTTQMKTITSPKLSAALATRSRSNSLTSTKLFALNQANDGTSSSPIYPMPPNVASSTPHAASPMAISTSVDQYFPSHHNSSSTTVNLTPTVSSPSIRSLNTSTTSTMKSFKPLQKQYVLNEQLYLSSMKNKPVDDYYTRGITSSGNEDDDDFRADEENDDFDNDLSKLNANLGSAMFGNNISTAADRGFRSIDDDELVLMNDTILLERMEWLRSVDPDNSVIENSLNLLTKRGGSKDGLDDSKVSYIETQLILEQLSNIDLVRERLEWQTMLSSVLNGEIVKSEKTKLAKRKPDEIMLNHNDLIWIELKAWFNGRTVEDQSKSLEYAKATADAVFQEVLNYKNEKEGETELIMEDIVTLLNKYYRVMSYWKNIAHMNLEKPITKSSNFISRIETLNSLKNSYEGLQYEIEALKKWTQNDDLDVTFTKDSLDTDGIFKNDRSFAEQIMKEKDIEAIFQKKIFYKHAPLMFKCKLVFLRQKKFIHEMQLPLPVEKLYSLLTFPLRLIQEIISIRLEYARKLKKPTMMMIDQMIDDFSTYIKLSVQIKHTLLEYRSGWKPNIEIPEIFDAKVVEAIEFLFKLLHLKLIDSSKNSFRTFKEPEILFAHWENLKNLGCYITGASTVVAQGFVNITIRLLNRLYLYIIEQQRNTTSFEVPDSARKWVVGVIENVGSFKRKTNRFSNVLTKAFQNSVRYDIQDHNLLLEGLKNSGHFLIYTGGILEQNGIYLIASEELLGCSDEEIMDIIKSAKIGSDLIPKVGINNSLAIYNPPADLSLPEAMFVQKQMRNGVSYYHIQEDNVTQRINNRGKATTTIPDEETEDLVELENRLKMLGYLLVFCPKKPMVWNGEMYNLTTNEPLTMEEFNINIEEDTIVLLNQGSTYALEYQVDKFHHFVGDVISIREKKCAVDSIETALQRINKQYFRMTYIVLANFSSVQKNITATYNDIGFFNIAYLFVKDFAKNFLLLNVATPETKAIIIRLMIQMSIDWLTFVLDECDPANPETFRWCVPAMEFAMQMTNGWNILGIDEKKFKVLKEKIAGCMSLLISHFDITGAREAERINAQQSRPNFDIDDADDDMILAVNSEMRMNAILEMESDVGTKRHYSVGKVIDETDNQSKFLKSLASSISNLSIRWQKRNFIGSGSFGNVYSAVNLDTGDILAVKEIKIQDAKSMKQIFPSLKEEMRVMEILNHPNIVQYYGVEVHRDKVNIFMEFCEGSSLACLLEHGRIEDEMVTQVYTLQLLEGLACLHQSGVVHRDIKPENILLDRNGVIKYVDFGAAKLIAKNGSKKLSLDSTKASTGGKDMIGTPMYMAPETVTGQGHGKFGSDDIWSLGCVVLEMVTGRRPWANLDNEWAIMYHVAAGHLPQFPNKSEISSAGRKFISRSLIQDANKRATAMELLLDPWITQIRKIAFGDSTDSTNCEK
ncbi:unnamed protein product [Kluyveromyces dobzhanskii CBS 2104]|uniref:MAP kinase kinase kinase n=1 Tax=Kluyveromyces dobzhanskii CBS 2104 TaxID=1427455 RepID=A0A0A8L2I7_9SACH|nr:unnamed protein product [Kluyveromyces dobzhanskii CBS 2104]